MPKRFTGSAGPRLAVIFATAITLSNAFAAFPDRPMRMVVPFTPGGGTDLIARTLGAEMSRDLGQPVIIDNKPGTTSEPSPVFKGVPPVAVIGRLNSAARKAARAPEFARKIEAEGLAVSAGTPAELESHVPAEERRWSRVVKENGIKPE